MIALTEAGIAQCLSSAHVQNQGSTVLEFPGINDFVQGATRQAAVLVPLLQIGKNWHVLLTRRNADLPEHSGQVAFPGGQADPEDLTAEQTALREAWEEIGLHPEDVHILGRLPIYLTITNFLVTPIVGAIPWPYEFSPKPDEVARVFTIPLDWLADPANHEVRQRKLPAPQASVDVVYFKIYDGELLWGASARFTLALLDALKLI